MISDLRFALRQLVKNPGFTFIAVLSLALGIGATVSVFSIVSGALLRTLPYLQPERLAFVTLEKLDGTATNASVSAKQFMEWTTQTQSFSRMAGYDWTFNFLIHGDRNQSLEGMVCSSALFDVLGVRPQLGRTFTTEEKSVQDHPVVIIGHRLWQERFAGDAAIIGKTIQLSRLPALTVIGVMPPQLRFLPSRGNAREPNYDLHAQVDYWLPATPNITQRNERWNVVTRLKPGVSPRQAQAEMGHLSEVQALSEPSLTGFTVAVTPIEQVLSGQLRRVVLPLFGAVCFVLLIAGANVAGLLLVRGLGRQRELALRAALGAGWARLLRLVLTESLLLALIGGLLGTALAFAGTKILVLTAPNAIPRLDQVEVDVKVLGFAFVVSLLAGLCTGVLTAWQMHRPDTDQALKVRSGGQGHGPSHRRILGALVAGEVALTLILLIGMALMLQSTRRLAHVDPGYTTNKILTMVVTTLQQNREQFHQQALQRLAALPGVKSAAFAWGLPLTGNNWMGTVRIEGQPAATQLKDTHTVPYRSVSPDYFSVMGISLREGRGFTEHDRSDAPLVVIINETMARRYFPNDRAIGKRLIGPFGPPREIVGIVNDIKNTGLSASAEPEVYLSFFQVSPFSKHLVIRTQTDPLGLAALTRSELQQIDPGVVVEEVKAMTQIREDSISSQRFAMTLLTVFSILAVALSVTGIYGVMSHSVLQRSHEIGIRMAIGAQQYDVLRLILRQGFVLAATGIFCGLAGAFVLTRSLQNLLFEIAPTDPPTFVGIAFLLSLVILLACWLPARRATKIDPMIILRAD